VGVTGAQPVASALERAGVEVVFGLPGVHNLALWPALADSPIRLVGVRHEQAAAYAADGYARASGKVGVALVTTGPGAANTLAAVGEAWASRSPVVVIATDVPTALRREGVHRGLLHEVPNQRAMFEPVTKATLRAEHPEALGGLVTEALVTATAAPSRPVFVEIPTDLLSAEVEGGSAEPRVTPDVSAETSNDSLDSAARVLAQAQRPLIWVGGGAMAADAGEAVGLVAERLAAPVLATYSARGLLPPDHACLVGLPPHVPEAGALWDEADVVLAIGSDLDGMMTQNWAQPAPPKLVAINVDPLDAVKNYDAEIVIEGDASRVAAALADALPIRDGLDELATRLADLRRVARERMTAEFGDEVAFLDAFAAAVPDDATVVCDMCIPGYWLGGFHPVPAPRRLAYPMGWGTLGWAFPAAIGSALGGPGPSVAVCGDGGFLFACGELATVAQERPPLTALIVDDRGYGMLRYDYARTGAEPLGVDLDTPDFVALAQSFGVRAEAVDGLADAFSAALGRHVADPEPSVLVARAALQPPPTTSPRWYRHR
jgi:thiamine pyrophosphate-dependent acetolactate synthase large subunit-like protein